MAANKATTESDAATIRIKELEAALAKVTTESDLALKRALELEIRYQESERRITDLQSQIDRLDRQNMDLMAKSGLPKTHAVKPERKKKAATK